MTLRIHETDPKDSVNPCGPTPAAARRMSPEHHRLGKTSYGLGFTGPCSPRLGLQNALLWASTRAVFPGPGRAAHGQAKGGPRHRSGKSGAGDILLCPRTLGTERDM